MRTFIASMLFVTAVLAQDSNVHETKFKYEKAIRQIAGVLDVTVGGANGEMRIVVRVATAEARDAVAALTGGKLDGFAVHVIVSGGSKPAAGRPCASCACPCHSRPGTTVAEPAKPEKKIDLTRVNDLDYAAEQCDVLRELLGMPVRESKNGVRCTQMTGWTNDVMKIKWILAEELPHWRAKELTGLRGSDYKDQADLKCLRHGTHGNGEVICYSYIKHRQFCPRGMKELLRDYEKLTPGK